MFLPRMTFYKKFFALFLMQLLLISNSVAQMSHEHSNPMGPSDCSEMYVWDFSFSTCRPLAMAGMPMKMLMIHGNGFLVQNFAEGPRGRNQFSAPNMIMGDFGSTAGANHYLDVNLMLTFEKWTFPKRGYPELLQIGESDKDERPYIDGQHPHSSPIMGLTFSDTINLGDKKHLKLFFAPRGQATEGPVAFMHRATGMINPDAPLGHHIGQDVSHITSTVVGASFGMDKIRLEASAFNGREPEPSEVDLPIGRLNSYGVRLIYQFSEKLYAMTSAAYVKNPEPHDPTITKNYRYSTSVYSDLNLNSSLMFHNTFLFGLVNYYDNFSKLRSFGDEFLFHSKDLPHNFWGRVEMLERGARELNITSNDKDPKWVSAITAGYTYDLIKSENGKLGIGFSVTKDFLPEEFKNTYGGNPVAGKVFVQLMGMKMGEQ